MESERVFFVAQLLNPSFQTYGTKFFLANQGHPTDTPAIHPVLHVSDLSCGRCGKFHGKTGPMADVWVFPKVGVVFLPNHPF